MARHRSGVIHIDVDELLDQVDDDCLLDELRARKIVAAPSGEVFDLSLVREAYEELRAGRSMEALAILDRALHPKWPSVRACEVQFIAATKGYP